MNSKWLNRAASAICIGLMSMAVAAYGGGGGGGATLGPGSPGSSQKTAFIANAGSDTVTRCAIAADGSLDCSHLGAVGWGLGFSGSTSVAISGSTAYITALSTPSGTGGVVRCTIAVDGSLSDCSDAGVTGLAFPFGLNVNGSFLYVSDNAGTITRCAIAGDGTLTGCRDSGATALDAPENILFSGSSAYVVNFGGYVNNRGSITRCTHNAADGLLSACVGVSAGWSWSSPSGGAINGSILYVADSAAGNVIRCTIETDGSLSGCANASAPGLETPTQIAINGSIAYVLNANGTMTRCTIATDSFLIDCADSGAGALSSPTGIAIK